MESQTTQRTAPSVPEIQQPRFPLPMLLTMVFSNQEVGSYLVSKDPFPPTNPVNIAQNSISINSMLIPHASMKAFCLARVEPSEDEEEREFGVTADKANAIIGAMAPPRGEDCFYVLHSNNEDYAFITVVDHRTPVAFLERPAAPVSGLRRVVQLKLAKFGHPHVSVALVYFWLADGKSSMVLIVHDTENGYYTEKNFVLFKPYPSSRFPRATDVLESMLAFEEFFCPFCESRGYIRCECAYEMMDRQKTPIPPKHMRDPWSLHQFTCSFFEGPLKKYSVHFRNVEKKATYSSISFHQCMAFTAGDDSHARGLREYMQELRPFVEEQLRAKSVFLHPDQRPSRLLITGGLQGTKRHASELESRDIEFSQSVQKQAKFETIPVHKYRESTKGKEMQSSTWNAASEQNEMLGEKLDIIRNSVYAATTMSSEESALTHAEVMSYLQEIEQTTFSSSDRKVCKLCSSSFGRTHDLKRHIYSKHLQKRGFSCNECGVHFTRASHLELHKKSKHENVQHNCPHCNHVFTYLAACLRHIRTRHDIDK